MHISVEQKNQSESYFTLLTFALPEVVSVTILIFLPIIIDLYFIACLKSTAKYQALSMSTNIIHLLAKMAEGACVATTVTVGRFNGAKQKHSIYDALFGSLLAAACFGTLQMLLVFNLGPVYLFWMGQSFQAQSYAFRFLQLQSVALFFSFLTMTLFGFFRGIKRPELPMIFNILGIGLFLCADYALIFGQFGCPCLGLTGSALASLLRYSFMFSIATLYACKQLKLHHFLNPSDLSKYLQHSWQVSRLTLPMMLDKAVLSCSYIWLYKMVAGTAPFALTAVEVIKNLERFAFIPTLALAQVTTFIISNNLGQHNFYAARQNLCKFLALGLSSTMLILLGLCCYSYQAVGWFDHQAEFTDFATQALRIISPLVAVDVFQVIIAAACRSSGLAQQVFQVRLAYLAGFFLPCSWLMSSWLTATPLIKFCLVYSTFLVTTGLIGFTLAAFLYQKLLVRRPAALPVLPALIVRSAKLKPEITHRYSSALQNHFKSVSALRGSHDEL